MILGFFLIAGKLVRTGMIEIGNLISLVKHNGKSSGAGAGAAIARGRRPHAKPRMVQPIAAYRHPMKQRRRLAFEKVSLPELLMTLTLTPYNSSLR